MIDKSIIQATSSWPFVEARKLVKERQKIYEKKGKITLQTGYGPSGLPHIGTFAEVARTTMMVNAIKQIIDIPTEIITFSDDMDGLRKVPDNIPNKEILEKNLHKPLTSVPDPFKKFKSFGEHNNEMLKKFLNKFNFTYVFKSSTEIYKKGLFNESLLVVLDKYEQIIDIILPTLGKERQKTYSPFLPICPETGKVLEVPVVELKKKEGKIIYENKQYIKFKDNLKVIHYPNKRILRVVKSLDYQLDLIISSYCLDQIDFKNDDIVIDCGANVGELNLALKKRNLDLIYYAFEPDEETFQSLKLNNSENIDFLYKLGLSNKNAKINFYLDTDGGNSSIINFGSKDVVEIQAITLDSIQIEKKIKLFKVEAEGYEPEVLEGAKSTLRFIEYISVDFGPERGVNSENTVVKVNNILTEAGFELVEFSNYRVIGLYRNKSE